MSRNLNYICRDRFFAVGRSPHGRSQLCPLLGCLLCLVLVAELPGCGPAASEHTPNQGGRASLDLSPESKARSQQITAPAKSPSAPAMNLMSPVSNHLSVPAAQEDRGVVTEYLNVPAWMAQALESRDASVRLQALDAWVQQGAHAPLDPLIVALDDEDDDVRDKAMAILEWQWAAWQEEEYQATN